MSRGQLRNTSSVCADCSAPDPGWASVNRGVLVCEECCSIHRSLGRHVSQIKSLRKGSWNPTQLQMVHQLVSSGANNIWEHSLLDPSQNKQGRRKPNPRDPVHPTKADFIRAKYQFLAFTSKQKDAEINTADDLSKQLHSSVRTSNLETSLRLLSLGADPNYYHPNKGNCPLHVAAQAGQATQVEILVVYGADPGAYDANGKTPVEHAKVEGHQDLADRLLECQYELTDRLAAFLCGRKPDHRVGQHFIIPEMADSSLDLSELAKAAKKKLQALPNHLFEELAMDVFDEVDRRENNSIWLASQTDSTLVSDRQTVPFLPVNPEFSSTRNQGRQKLARFNAREFATLIIDILSDARRRQHGLATPSSTGSTPSKQQADRLDRPLVKTNSLSDDEPLYDSVASDEDYASIGDNQSLKEEKNIKEKSMEYICDYVSRVVRPEIRLSKRSTSPTSMISFTESMASSEQSDGPITLEEYLEVKRALVESQARVQQLFQTNKDLKQEITLLQNMMQNLSRQNLSLRSASLPRVTSQALASVQVSCPALNQVQKLMGENNSLRRGENVPESNAVPNGHGDLQDAQLRNIRPQSMFEPRDPQRLQHWAKSEADRLNPSRLGPPGEVQRIAESDYDNTTLVDTASDSTRSSECSQITATDSGHSHSTEGATGGLGAYTDSGEDLALPTQDDVVKKTEKITKKIQELLLSAQEGKLESYPGCAEKITHAVHDMASLFPQNIKDECVVTALKALTDHTSKLQDQCKLVPPEAANDPRLQTQQVIQCAYEIAKAAKQLVMLFE